MMNNPHSKSQQERTTAACGFNDLIAGGVEYDDSPLLGAVAVHSRKNNSHPSSIGTLPVVFPDKPRDSVSVTNKLDIAAPSFEDQSNHFSRNRRLFSSARRDSSTTTTDNNEDDQPTKKSKTTLFQRLPLKKRRPSPQTLPDACLPPKKRRVRAQAIANHDSLFSLTVPAISTTTCGSARPDLATPNTSNIVSPSPPRSPEKRKNNKETVPSPMVVDWTSGVGDAPSIITNVSENDDMPSTGAGWIEWQAHSAARVIAFDAANMVCANSKRRSSLPLSLAPSLPVIDGKLLSWHREFLCHFGDEELVKYDAERTAWIQQEYQGLCGGACTESTGPVKDGQERVQLNLLRMAARIVCTKDSKKSVQQTCPSAHNS